MFWRELYRIARTIFSRFSARHLVYDVHTPSKDNPTRHRSEVRRDFLYVQLVDNKTGLLLVINCTQHSSPLLIFRANCVTKCIEMALHSMAICVQKAKKTRQKLGKLVFLSHLWAKFFFKDRLGSAISHNLFSVEPTVWYTKNRNRNMSKKSILLLCCSLCFVSATVANTPVRNTRSKQVNSKAKTERTKTQDSVRFLGNMVADRLEFRNKVSSEKEVRKAEYESRLAMESLNYPAVDIYGEDSWSEYVNPFVGADVEIPESYDIDCSSFVMPVEDKQVTSEFGYRRRFGRMHYGIDLSVNRGDTIRAAFDGKVRVRNYEHGGYGYYVIVRHPNGLETVYGHMSRQLVHENQIVRAGQPIGLGGSTGRSTGPHLHFETRFMGIPINPSTIIDFDNGVPLRDVYTFHRGSSTRYAKAGKGSRAASKRKGRNSATPKTYRIRKGDTLEAIAKRNGTTVAKLCAKNGISKTKTLTPGKALRIK